MENQANIRTLSFLAEQRLLCEIRLRGWIHLQKIAQGLRGSKGTLKVLEMNSSPAIEDWEEVEGEEDLEVLRATEPTNHSLLGILQGLDNARDLRIYRSRTTTNLKPLEGKQELQTLTLDYSLQLESSGWHHDTRFPVLRELSLVGSKRLRTLDGISQVENLVKLQVGHSPGLTDISAVGACQRLEYLGLDMCRSITTVECLKHCKSL